jgi:hypothetical protein
MQFVAYNAEIPNHLPALLRQAGQAPIPITIGTRQIPSTKTQKIIVICLLKLVWILEFYVWDFLLVVFLTGKFRLIISKQKVIHYHFNEALVCGKNAVHGHVNKR